jgi:hypothetical protein
MILLVIIIHDVILIKEIIDGKMAGPDKKKPAALFPFTEQYVTHFELSRKSFDVM